MGRRLGLRDPDGQQEEGAGQEVINFMTSTEVAVRLAQATSFFVTQTSVMEAMADSRSSPPCRIRRWNHIAPPVPPQAARRRP